MLVLTYKHSELSQCQPIWDKPCVSVSIISSCGTSLSASLNWYKPLVVRLESD